MDGRIPSKTVKVKRKAFLPRARFNGGSNEFIKHKLLMDSLDICEHLSADSVRELIHQGLNGREKRRLLILLLPNGDEALSCIL